MKTLKECFGLRRVYTISLSASLISMMFLIKNTGFILSEALSVHLFLLFMSYVIKWIKNKNTKHFVSGLVTVLFLLLVRGQFLFLIPAMLILIIIFLRKSFKQIVIFSMMVLIFLPVKQIIDRAYHKLVHGKFVSTPFGGFSVSIQPIFISEANDEALFSEETKILSIEEI